MKLTYLELTEMIRFIATAIFFITFIHSLPAQDSDQKKSNDNRYTFKKNHDPNGIGKFYLDREIALVMGHQGAGWLERPEREREENPKKLLESLDLKEGMVVVDLGAGSGYYSFRMAPLVGEKGKVLAVDIQSEMIEIIEKRKKKTGITNIETILSKEKDPKLPADSVDLILMVDVYHEFAYPYEMTEKMVQSLKKGGKLVFVEFRAEDPKVPIKEVHKMSERQVIREMSEFKNMKHAKTINTLPWQHIIVFEKIEPKK